jgi:small conductance mechanosensitive channel
MAEDAEFGSMILRAPRALRVDGFDEFGVQVKVLGDTQPMRQWDVMGELRRRLKKVFDEEGMRIRGGG